MDEHDAQAGRDGQRREAERLDRADQEKSAEQRGREVVDVTTRELLLGDERRGEHLGLIERRAEQRIRRDGTGDGRRGASALTAGERQSLLDEQRHTVRRIRSAQHFERGDAGGVTGRITRQIGMSRFRDANAAR